MEKRKNCNSKPKAKKQSAKRQNITVKSKKKKVVKLTDAQFADMNQIEWVPFDPYAD